MSSLKPSHVLQVLKLLQPMDVDLPKVRVGRQGDGGYVMLDTFVRRQPVYSYGIGTEISFDRQFAESGHPVFMFDHTIGGPPHDHENFHFLNEGLAPATDPDRSLYSLSDHLARHGHTDGLILKVDIEGAEWEVFANLPDDTLAAFSQIVFEAHDLRRLEEEPFRQTVVAALRKLRSQFTIHHVHSNNNAPVIFLAGVATPELLELSLVRTSLVKVGPSRTVYPTTLDYPCHRDTLDHLLWFYPYTPQADPGPLAYENCLAIAQSHLDIFKLNRRLKAAAPERA